MKEVITISKYLYQGEKRNQLKLAMIQKGGNVIKKSEQNFPFHFKFFKINYW